MNDMTHYMELLAQNQPWNLIVFMAIPVICAETIAITELMVLFKRNFAGTARKVNKVTGIFAGFYFLGIFIYLFINKRCNASYYFRRLERYHRCNCCWFLSFRNSTVFRN